MRLSYYPGCSLEGTATDYDMSVRNICRELGVELQEIDDWNCCGASSAHMTNHETGMRLPMRNLLLAQPMRQDILVPCAACFQRLKAADKALKEDGAFWDVRNYDPEFEIVHISTFLAQPEILERIRAKVSNDLKELSLACYYGCLSLRNPRITDAPNWEMPENLEKIVSALGAKPVRWSHRTECCSGSLTMTRPDIAMKLVGDITAAARRGGAKAMVTDCPMCQANVESRQESDGQEMVVYYITELVEAALSGRYPAARQKAHLVSAAPLTTVMGAGVAAEEESV